MQGINSWLQGRGERERLLGSREREGKLKITFPFYGKGTGIRKCYGKGMGNLRLVIPGIYKTSNVKFKIREALIREYFLVKSLHKMVTNRPPPPLSPFYEVPIYFFINFFSKKKMILVGETRKGNLGKESCCD